MSFDLYGAEAQSLRNSLAVAGEALKETRVGYQDAIEAFVDTNSSNDRVFELRRDGLGYAQAVRQYSSAVMAWLVFVDKQLHLMDNQCYDEMHDSAKATSRIVG